MRVRALILSALILLLAGSVVYQVVQDRRDVAGHAASDARNLSMAIAQNTANFLSAIDNALAGIQWEMSQTPGIETGRTHRHELLATSRALIDGVYAFFVLDAQGRLVHTSRTERPEPISFADRAIFLDAMAAGIGTTVIEAPRIGTVGYAAGQRIVNVGRKLLDGAGRPIGVAAAAVSIDEMEALLTTLEIGELGVARLYRLDDGVLIAQSRGEPGDVGRSYAGDPHFAELVRHMGAGQPFDSRGVDGIERLHVSHAVDGHGLVLVIGLATTEIFAAWRERVTTQLLLVGIAIAIAVPLAFFWRSSVRREGAAQAASLAQQREMARVSARIAAQRDVAAILRYAAEAARDLIGAHQAVASVRGGEAGAPGRAGAAAHEVSLSDKYSGWTASLADPDVPGLRRLVCDTNAAFRMKEAEIAAHPAWRTDPSAADMPPLRGWLASPLRDADGSNLGLIQLSDKYDGEFDTGDEVVLAQLSHIVSIAIQNARLVAALEDSVATAEAAAAAAHAAKQEVDTILATTSDGMYGLDRAYRFEFVNDAALRFFGRDREALIGRVIWDVFPAFRDGPLRRAFERTLSDGQSRAIELHDEARNVWTDTRCFRGEGGLVVYFQDTTLRKTAELQLRQAQKMEALGQLTGGVAHDFNNLLTVVIGSAQLLEADPDLPGRDRSMVRLIIQAGERGAALTAQLLSFARRQPLRPEPLKIEACVELILPLIRRTMPDNVTVDVSVSAAGAVAIVDGAQLELAILNLALNARDAMPSGGRIAIELGSQEVAAGDVDLAAGTYVRIVVADTGTGIAPEHLARVFEPFFTTKAAGKGSGLGLSMVYGFARQSGGTVTITSQPGVGTAVTLLLPSSAGAAATVPALLPQDHGALARGAGQTVLVVEDDTPLRDNAARMLTRLNYRPTTAPDAAAALELMGRAGPFDILFTDIVMPGEMDGAALAAAIREMQPGIRIAYTSGYTENAEIHRGRLEEGVTFVPKPYRLQDLATVMAALTASGGRA